MHKIALDASRWRSDEDVWTTLLPKLGAPAWHGRNLDALDDTLGEKARWHLPDDDCINRVQPPFHLIVANSGRTARSARTLLDLIAALIEDLNRELSVGIVLELR